MTVKLYHEIAIAAPPARVWEVLADLPSVAAYNPGVERAKLATPSGEGVGAARVCNFRDGGTVRETVTEWKPGEAMTLEMSGHPWPMKDARFRMTLEPNAKGTLLKQVTQYVFTGDRMADALAITGQARLDGYGRLQALCRDRRVAAPWSNRGGQNPRARPADGLAALSSIAWALCRFATLIVPRCVCIVLFSVPASTSRATSVRILCCSAMSGVPCSDRVNMSS